MVHMWKHSMKKLPHLFIFEWSIEHCPQLESNSEPLRNDGNGNFWKVVFKCRIKIKGSAKEFETYLKNRRVKKKKSKKWSFIGSDLLYGWILSENFSCIWKFSCAFSIKNVGKLSYLKFDMLFICLYGLTHSKLCSFIFVYNSVF